ncbi:hypothetical protein [Mesorhizobium sp. 1M-11]|uniref:hypothetical protein n=1 Tax=Mesorhizobium sp. 1M-11 TaxID=1529006 RepID=UPI0006C742BD|nr:hypothetical protein [Mesorhizobium sp. 1M-11]
MRQVFFSEMQDQHDKRAQVIIHEMEDVDGANAPIVTNLNLVGIRRRLNNIEAGVWALVIIAGVYTWRHW